MTFTLLNRNYDQTLVLLPGFAMDAQIFCGLRLPYNYLIPEKFNPFTFKDELLSYLALAKLSKIALLGFSLGGFVSYQFAQEYPNLVQKLILVSIRKKYPRKNLEQIATLIEKNKKGFLIDFYKRCFYRNEAYQEFKKTLLKQYLEIPAADLRLGLDYLASHCIESKELVNLSNLRIFHGKYDQIAPLAEVEDLLANTDANFTILDDGHIFMPES